MVVGPRVERGGVEDATQGRCREGGTGTAAAPANAGVTAVDCGSAAHRQRQLRIPPCEEKIMSHESLSIVSTDPFSVVVELAAESC